LSCRWSTEWRKLTNSYSGWELAVCTSCRSPLLFFGIYVGQPAKKTQIQSGWSREA